MKKALTILFLAFGLSCGAQTIEGVLGEIEKNNLYLKSAAGNAEALKKEYHAETMPEDPEVEYNYLFGTNDNGRRHDFKITQSFDFSMLVGAKARQFRTEAKVLDLEYLSTRSAILAGAEQICVDIVYYNALISFLHEQIAVAESFKALTDRQVAEGKGTKFDVGKSVLKLSALRSRTAALVEDRNELLLQLQALNGNKPLEFEIDDFNSLPVCAVPTLDEYISEVVENNPQLRYARAKADAAEGQLRLDKAAWAPKLTVGYMSEITTYEGFRGVTLGVALPLWKNSSRVQRSKAKAAASRYEAENTYIDIISALTSQHARMESMRNTAVETWASLEEVNYADYLKKARANGEISIIEFYSEMDLFFEAYESALDCERAYRAAVAGLNAYLR